MKKITGSLLIGLLSLFILACSSESSENNGVEITITNPTSLERTDEFVLIPIENLLNEVTNEQLENFILKDSDNEIPIQIVGDDLSNLALIFTINLNPNQTKVLQFFQSDKKNPHQKYQSRVYAELAMKVNYDFKDGKYTGGEFKVFDKVSVPVTHTDHNALFKYEGPGWESDKVGYRFYIDWRNRFDIFGKKTNEMVLSEVGIKDIYAKDDSYHEMQVWGMDILKVGESTGLGTFGSLVSNIFETVEKRDSVQYRLIENGPVRAKFSTSYYGWDTGRESLDLVSDISINAGSRSSRVNLTTSSQLPNITTGIVKAPDTEYFENIEENSWSYIATYGVQSLSEDKLGMAVFFNSEALQNTAEVDDSWLITLNVAENSAEYYFAAAWEHELNGIKNKDEFTIYLNNELEKLNNPVDIKIKK
ncbi:MAG: DUF4861 domain-containing protein [Melioribacteraceae bacterium]|nr:DUF4861 domain-containing protein [Melioribacteraceae bacterium]MCF8265708.1 DUF4861 domain-containing protein [Melioribacteraceae bacterium]MCF8432173.1 DUF4861 domain-containing protein [Melioribacteraceae bacterium]